MSREPANFGEIPEGITASEFVCLLEEHGESGYWRANFSTGETFWSARACEIHGSEHGYAPSSLDEAADWFHRDDRASVRCAFRTARESGEPISFTHRIVKRCGAERWIEMRGKLQRNTMQTDPIFFGIFRDVTEQRQTEAELQEAAEFNRRVRSAIGKMDGAFVIFDAEDRLYLCNDQYKALYRESASVIEPGVRFEDMVRYGIENGQYVDAIGNEEAFLAERMRAHQEPSGPIEQRLPDDRWIRVSESVTEDGSRAGFRIDVTAMKSLQRQLQEKANEALAAGKIKDRFLANMSHELRTPLNAVIGFAQLISMLQQQGKVCEQVGGYATDIENSGLYLLRVIEDLFRMAQMKSEHEALEIETVTADEVFAVAESQAACLAQRYGQNIEFVLPERGKLRFLADRSKISKVMLSLISNGFKFAPKGTTLRISAEAGREGGALIKVIDEGPGIADDEIEKVFEPFERLNACSDAIEGIGVGLAFARELVQQMGGQIGVVSGLRRGSTFWVSLPGAEAANGESRADAAMRLDAPATATG